MSFLLIRNSCVSRNIDEVIKDNIVQDYLIALSEDVAPLGVSQDHPFYTTVLDHRRAADRLDSNNKTQNNPVLIL